MGLGNEEVMTMEGEDEGSRKESQVTQKQSDGKRQMLDEFVLDPPASLGKG